MQQFLQEVRAHSRMHINTEQRVCSQAGAVRRHVYSCAPSERAPLARQ